MLMGSDYRRLLTALFKPKILFMNTCSSCKYWGNNWPVQADKANECGKISLDVSHSKDPAFIDADASDDTGLYANLMTISTFGCNLHAPKY